MAKTDNRPTATQRGYNYEWSKIAKAQLTANPICARCGRKATCCDHIKPKRYAGTDHPSNLQSLCRGCNRAKVAEDAAKYATPGF